MGRGFVMLTGRGPYTQVSTALGLGTTLVDSPWLAEEGKNSSPAYDYVTKIAITGMVQGSFTGAKLSTYDNPDGTYRFDDARAIIGWNMDTAAGNLGRGYARILSRHCPLGGVSEGIKCQPCPPQ